MKKRILYLFSLIVLLLGGGTSCEDQLDIEKKGNLGGEEDFYQTDADAISAITTTYAQWNSMHANMFMMLDMLSDDVWCGGANRADQLSYHYLNEYCYGSNSSVVEDVFKNLYGIIYRANLVIERVSADSDVKRRCIAEAYFFRGWANFYLGALWGTAPLVDHLLAPGEYSQPNSEEGVLLAQASKDFQTAIDMKILPSKTSIDDRETGIRITQECAYAFLGKSLLWEGKKSEAASALDKVIASGLYDLYEGDYGDIHKVVAEFCRESILENNQVDDPNTAWSFMSYIHVLRGWRNDQLSWTKLKPEYSNVTSGYGFDNPRKELYDSFKAYDKAGGGDDYRLDRTIKDLDFLSDKMGLTVTAIIHGNEGYFNWKLRAQQDEIITAMGGWNVLVSTNWRFMRYAEVLLLAAEANLESNPGKSLEYVNKIRTRAHLTPLSNVTLSDIKNEKRFELCFEGTRYMDLVRWNDAATVLANQGKSVYGLKTDGTAFEEYTSTKSGFVAGKHERLPIPATEILLNGAIHQNPGWTTDSGEETLPDNE